MKKLIAFLLGFGLLFTSTGTALAIDTWHLSINRAGIDTNYNLDDPGVTEPHVLTFDQSSGYYNWATAGAFKSIFLDQYQLVSVSTLSTAIASATSTLVATENSLQSEINTLSSVGTFSLSTAMANQASTTALVASSTFNGFMSGAMVTKLAALSTSTPIHIERIRATTNSSGTYTFTFTNSFSNIPVVSTDVENTVAGITQVYIASISTSSVTVQTSRAQNVLGILTLQSAPQLTVHIIAVEP